MSLKDNFLGIETMIFGFLVVYLTVLFDGNLKIIIFFTFPLI